MSSQGGLFSGLGQDEVLGSSGSDSQPRQDFIYAFLSSMPTFLDGNVEGQSPFVECH
jgi:hypothetical protein